MSYTSESEEIEEEKAAVKTALDKLMAKLGNRVLVNSGDWRRSHRDRCQSIMARITTLILDLEEL